QIAAHLTAARRLIESRNCTAALAEHIRPVLEADPSNPEALALSRAASECVPPSRDSESPRSPSGRSPSTAIPQRSSGCPGEAARAIPLSEGGLPLRDPCEPARDYAARVRAMQDRYDQAATAFASGAHQRAAGLFDGIYREAGERYRDVAAR